jgi:cysteine desulfurase
MSAYLDYNATTPLDPRVREAMLPYLGEIYGNPSSVHWRGRLMRSAIEQAREQVASLVNAHPSQVVFTGCGTEANNLAIKGACATFTDPEVVISSIEHASVLEAAQAVTKPGVLKYIPVDAQGVTHPDAVLQTLSSATKLVSVMWANNETGAIQPIAAIGAALADQKVIFHTDATQAIGKHPVDFASSGAQLMTLSGHKMYASQGVGVLIHDKRVNLQPLLHGGGHEKGRRSGTENVAAIVGLGVAASLIKAELQTRITHMRRLREVLEQALQKIEGVVIFSQQAERLPNTVQFAIPNCHGETLLMQLDKQGIAVSSGSACHSDVQEPSHVLTAMGVDDALALTAIRVSVGKDTTIDEVQQFCQALYSIVNTLRSQAMSAA